jgi:hypothetical protein
VFHEASKSSDELADSMDLTERSANSSDAISLLLRGVTRACEQKKKKK